MASSTEDVQAPWDTPDSPLTDISDDSADVFPLGNKSSSANGSLQIDKSSPFQSNEFFQSNHSSESSHNEPQLSNEFLLNKSMDPQGHGGQGGDPEVAGRCKRGGQAKRSQSSRKKGAIPESEELEDVNAAHLGIDRPFEVTQMDALPEDQTLGFKGDLFLSYISSCCRIVQLGTSHNTDFDLDAVQQILCQVVTPGASTINPYRIARHSAPTHLSTPMEVEKWYELETMKGFLNVCIDLEKRESVLQFSYMITTIQFVSKIIAYGSTSSGLA